MPMFNRHAAHALACLILLCTCACSSEFLVDNGQIENIQGVVFSIKPPHLFIKKAFNLRKEALSSAQLSQISDAMPAIAAFTDAMLSNTNKEADTSTLTKGARALRPLMHTTPQTQLFVKTIQNWQVQPGTIDFTTDYFYTNAQGEFESVRDNYTFVLTPSGWQFSTHPKAQAEGLLSCIKSAKGWRVCDVVKISPTPTPTTPRP
jgi:hypothetical protein